MKEEIEQRVCELRMGSDPFAKGSDPMRNSHTLYIIQKKGGLRPMSMDLEEDYEKIYRYCYMKLKHQQTAEDITQETFLCFLEGGAYKEIGKRLAFLYTIARNKCNDFYRAKVMLELKEVEGEDKEDDLIVSMDLERAVSKLSKEEQELVFLRYVNEETINNISKIMNISRFSVRRKLQKCLKILETTLGKGGEWS